MIESIFDVLETVFAFDIPDLLNTILFTLIGIVFGSRVTNHINTLRSVSGQPPIMIRGGRGMWRRQPLRPARNTAPPELTNTHQPTPKDCADVKSIMAHVANFPPELVDIVMDFAEYWACSVAAIDYSVTAQDGSGERKVLGGHGREDQFLLRTEPVGLTTWHAENKEGWQSEAPPRRLGAEYSRPELERFVEGPPSSLEHPFRKVVFDITSHDQGWSAEVADHNTFRPAYTWFDAGVDRFDKSHACSDSCEANASSSTRKVPTTCAIRPIWPMLEESEGSVNSEAGYHHELHAAGAHRIQCNRHADRNWQHHHVEWSSTDEIDPDSTAAVALVENGRGHATGDGSFVRNLKVGDMVTIWGRARYAGWVNHVQKIEVRVYWAL
ncbi:hypothetical protein F5Y18DRAFT_118446 [Xylariaceae sp. FL1019]|nr:hypothetical protein F5Y18DRAFT_118446 [Xylariaceae sp. FL1019]